MPSQAHQLAFGAAVAFILMAGLLGWWLNRQVFTPRPAPMPAAENAPIHAHREQGHLPTLRLSQSRRFGRLGGCGNGRKILSRKRACIHVLII